MIYQHHNITSQFIQLLFQNQTFQTYFQKQLQQHIHPQSEIYNSQSSHHQQPQVLNDLSQQIAKHLIQSLKLTIDNQFDHIYKANLLIINQIQNIQIDINNLKTHNQSSTLIKQKTVIPFTQLSIHQQSNQFNHIQIRKDIQLIKNKLNQLSFTNSFTDDLQIKDDAIDQKINKSIQQKLVKVQLFIHQKLSVIQKQWNQKNQLTNKTLQNLISLVNQINLADNCPKKSPQRSLSNLFGLK